MTGVLGMLRILGGAAAGSQGLSDGAIYVTFTGIAQGAGGVEVVNEETGEEHVCAVVGNGCVVLHLAPGEYRLSRGLRIEVSAGATTEVRLIPGGGNLKDGVGLTAGMAVGTAAGAGAEPDQDEDGLVSVDGLASTQTGVVVDGATAVQGYRGVPVGAGSDPALDAGDDADSLEATAGPSHGLGRGRHAGVAYPFAEGSVREFRVGTENYSAQAGSAGGVLTAVTREGGEHVHGSGYFHVRSDVLAAKDPLAVATSYLDGVITSGVVKPHDLRENFGGTVGGSVPRARGLRYFAAAEVQRRGFPAVSSPANALFYQLTDIQRALLGTRGVSSRAINTGLNYLSSLTGVTPRRADEDVEFGRVDWRLLPRLVVGAEYNRVRWNSPAGLIEAPVVARGRASLGNAAGSVNQMLMRMQTDLTANTANELRLALTRDLQYERPQTPLAGEPAIGPNGTAPEVNIGPEGLLFGTPATLSQQAYPDEQRMEVSDVVTLVRGRHLVEFGGTYSAVHEEVATLGNAAGTFRYDSGETNGYAGGLVDFLTDYTFNVNSIPNGGCPRIDAEVHLFCFRSFTQSFGETTAAFSTADSAGFVEDTWRPRIGGWAGLMFHAGVRYEYTRLPPPQKPNAALDAVFGARGATSVFPEDRNNFGPRLSASFEPLGRGRGLVKIGYGVFFGRLPGATILAALSETGMASSTTKIRLRASTETPCPQMPGNGFGYPCSFTGMPTGIVAQTTSAMVFDRRFRLPVIQQGSLTLERQIGRKTTISVGTVLNEDGQLPSSTDMNIAPSTGMRLFQLQGGTGAKGVRDGETFVVPVYTARVTPDFGPVTEIVSHVNATYDGLVVRVNSRAVRGVLLAANYTWSKAIDFGQAASATPRTDGQFDPFANGYDKGLSSLNYPEAMYAEAVWNSHFEGRGVRRVVDGWTVAAITTARSGRPYSFDLSGGPYLAGGHESLNGSGGALYLPTVGRNTSRLPATMKTDVRVGKGFRVGNAARGEAVIEAFNVFNHQAIASVNQRAYLVEAAVGGVTPLVFQNAAAIAAEGLNTTAFGTPTATSTGLNRERQVELSLKISF